MFQIQQSDGVEREDGQSGYPFPNLPPNVRSITVGDSPDELVIFDDNDVFHIYNTNTHSYETIGDVCIN